MYIPQANSSKLEVGRGRAVVCDQPSRWNVHGALEPLSRQLRLTLNVLGEHNSGGGSAGGQKWLWWWLSGGKASGKKLPVDTPPFPSNKQHSYYLEILEAPARVFSGRALVSGRSAAEAGLPAAAGAAGVG